MASPINTAATKKKEAAATPAKPRPAKKAATPAPSVGTALADPLLPSDTTITLAGDDKAGMPPGEEAIEQEEEILADSLTADSPFGKPINLGKNYAVAFHLVLTAGEKAVGAAPRSPVPIIDTPFNQTSGLIPVALKAFAERVQSKFDSSLLVVGDAAKIDEIVTQIIYQAVIAMESDLIDEVAQHLGPANLNEVFGLGTVADGEDPTPDQIRSFLNTVVGYKVGYAPAAEISDNVSKTVFVISLRLSVPGLIDVRDIFGAHTVVENTLANAIETYEIQNLRLTWLISDLSLKFANNVSLLGILSGHLSDKVNYYQSCWTREIEQAMDQKAKPPLSDLWQYFQFDSQQDVLASCAYGKITALSGFFVATVPYAGFGMPD